MGVYSNNKSISCYLILSCLPSPSYDFVRIYIHVYAFVIPSAQVETKEREFIDLFEKFPDGGGETPAVPVCEDWHG